MPNTEKLIDTVDLKYYHDNIASGDFAAQDDLVTLSDAVESIVNGGGEPNTIEAIKVNGTTQPITNKEVDIDLSGYAEDSDIPTAVSELTNDAGYQTESDVSAAIADAVGDINQFDQQVVSELPQTGEKGVIIFNDVVTDTMNRVVLAAQSLDYKNSGINWFYRLNAESDWLPLDTYVDQELSSETTGISLKVEIIPERTTSPILAASIWFLLSKNPKDAMFLGQFTWILRSIQLGYPWKLPSQQEHLLKSSIAQTMLTG